MYIVREQGFDGARTMMRGNKFLIGNGRFGYRGTMEEDDAEAGTALNLAGVYDGVAGKWRESVNAPNPLYTRLYSGETLLSAERAVSHEQSLDIRRALHMRKSVFECRGAAVTVESERFASMAETHLLAMRFRIRADKDVELRLETGIDAYVWDLNGPHLENIRFERQEGVLCCRADTQEKKIPVCVVEYCILPAEETGFSIRKEGKKALRVCRFTAKAGKEYELIKLCRVFVGGEPVGRSLSYEEERTRHFAAWDELWKFADVEIDGDERAQFALRYSIYHLLILAPQGKNSIPARGLSGQTYKGAVFWDTEIFLFPFFLAVQPQTARRLLEYRIATLGGARRKAESYGYGGAFFAWESQETGDDACSAFNVTDVFTGRPVRTYFLDKQIHIDGDIVYAFNEYIGRTQDYSILAEGGMELIAECAAFYYSYAYYSPYHDRVDITDVIGPDEYHERVTNNAFTNRMVLHTWEVFAKMSEEYRRRYPSDYESLDARLHLGELASRILSMREKLARPKQNADGVIEQFDGYFGLENVRVETVRSRLKLPNEYWGGSNGVATATQVIKQADVIAMLCLFPEYPQAVELACFEYYFPRTEHGSSLSASMYGLQACRLGETDYAYEMMLKSAEADLSGETKQYAGGIYIGGTHPAASGGAWMVAVFGFAGLRIRDGKIGCVPNLPKGWKGVRFCVRMRDKLYRIAIGNGKVKIEETDS